MARRALAAIAGLAGLAGCAGSGPPAAPVAVVAAAAPVATPPEPVAWPEAADCRGLAAALLAMPEAGRGRLRAGDAPLAVAVRDGVGLLPAGEAAAAVEVDLPVPIVDRADAAPCLVLAGRPRLLPGGGRRLVGHETVASEYVVGARRPAPARSGGERGEDARVLRTGDPGLDLIGIVAGSVIGGLGRLGRGDVEERAGGDDGGAAAARPYAYEVSTFEVARAGELGVALVDARAGRVVEVRHTVRERELFPVAKGRHRSDRGVLEGTGRAAVPAGEVAAFEASPPRPRLSGLLRALLDGGGEGRAGGPEEALAGLAGRAGTAMAGRRVVVETLAGPAEGTWLDAGRIAVPASALGRSSTVRVGGPGGARSFGIVESVDRERDAAVVRVGGGREAFGSALDGLKSPGGR